jgi:hypothetical protein
MIFLVCAAFFFVDVMKNDEKVGVGEGVEGGVAYLLLAGLVIPGTLDEGREDKL